MAFFLASEAAMLLAILQISHGHLVYPLDDTYIGMAMAKNLAQHGVYGMTKYGFTSSSSSPLFVLAMAACYAVVGVREWVPLVLSISCAAAALLVADRIFRRWLPDDGRFIALVCLSALAPLPTTGVLGMEHTLHIFLALLFIDQLVRFLEAHGTPGS